LLDGLFRNLQEDGRLLWGEDVIGVMARIGEAVIDEFAVIVAQRGRGMNLRAIARCANGVALFLMLMHTHVAQTSNQSRGLSGSPRFHLQIAE